MIILEKVIITIEEAKQFAKAASCAHGIPEEEARILADILIETDMRGIMTHGLIRLPEYLDRIDGGGMVAALSLEKLRDWDWGGALDAGNGIGHVAAYKGMEWTIEKAKKLGIGMATMRMSNHFGMASYYSLMAAKQGMIGLVASNTAPLMAPWGGKEVKIGNNPLAIAVPGIKFPISFDMANSIAARSKLYTAERENKQIPKGWALNSQGNETTDPTEAIKGALLSMAGHKGYGLALMIDMLTGVLSGGTVSPNIKNKYDYSSPRDVGHFFLAINIEHFLPLNEFLKRADSYVNILQETQPTQGFERVRVTGEEGDRKRNECLENGITYHTSSINILNEMAEKLNIPQLQVK